MRMFNETLERTKPNFLEETGLGPEPSPIPLRAGTRLADLFTEILAYTLYLQREMGRRPFPYEEVRKNFDLLWERAREMSIHRETAPQDWEAAAFAVCALVDETLLCSPWTESGRWTQEPLQLLFFRTLNAGDEFFRRLEALPAGDAAVREVYAYCLALGFRGRYFAPGDEAALREVQAANLRMLGRTDPRLPEKLFPAGEARPAGRKKPQWTLGKPVTILLFLIGPAALVAFYFTYQKLLQRMFDTYLGMKF